MKLLNITQYISEAKKVIKDVLPTSTKESLKLALNDYENWISLATEKNIKDLTEFIHVELNDYLIEIGYGFNMYDDVINTLKDDKLNTFLTTFFLPTGAINKYKINDIIIKNNLA